MKILSTSLLVSFMTIFATSTHAGSNDSGVQSNQQAKPRLANCKDCIDAGYRRGFADGEAAALENTPAGSSSVTTPLSYRKSVYVQAPSTQPRQVKAPVAQPKPRFVQAPSKKQAHHANAPALTTAPRKLPAYVQRITPTVQPNVPTMAQPKPRIQHDRHAGHGHHTQAEVMDCELTDALNRSASPVTTVLSTKKYYQPAVVKHQQRPPVRKPAPMKRIPNIEHNGHYHHTAAEKADCELTDALNRQARPVSRVIRSSSHQHHSRVKQYLQKKPYKHGNHWHSNEVERADCALTDALNRGGSIVRVVHKH